MIASRLSVLALALGLAACVPPPAQQGDTTGGGGTAAATCDDGCAHLIGCGAYPGGDQGACVDECHRDHYDQAAIDKVMAMSCDDMQQGAPTGGEVLCEAAGVYEVCDGTYCTDHDADSSGDGATKDAAASAAVQACNAHMSSLVMSNQMNYQASIKQSCEVTSCR